MNENKLEIALTERRSSIVNEETSLSDLGHLFQDLGVIVLDDVQNWDKGAEPFISGVITNAFVDVSQKFRGDGEEGRFMVDMQRSTGETTRVYCPMKLCVKFWGLVNGLKGLRHDKWRAAMEIPGEERAQMVSHINREASELRGFYAAILFEGVCSDAEFAASSTAIDRWNKFQMVVLEPAMNTPETAAALERLLVPGTRWTRAHAEPSQSTVDGDI